MTGEEPVETGTIKVDIITLIRRSLTKKDFRNILLGLLYEEVSKWTKINRWRIFSAVGAIAIGVVVFLRNGPPKGLVYPGPESVIIFTTSKITVVHERREGGIVCVTTMKTLGSCVDIPIDGVCGCI